MDAVRVGLKRLGYLFYIADPSSSSFETKTEIPNYVAEVFPLFFILIFLERLILYKKRGRAPPINDSLTSTACGLFLEVKDIAIKSSATALYIYVYENYSIYRLAWDSVYTWILCALLYDLGYYWGHRAAHEINLFWSQHQVHHSSEEYNLSTALRQAAFQGETTMFFYLPMALFIPPTQYIVHSQFNLLYQFWIHTEVIDHLGPLEWILNTPSHHRVHHGADRYCVDKNYAGFLIIWDRIFGTFEPERRDRPITYGLIDQVQSFNPFYLQTFYLVKVFQKMFSMPGIVNKWGALFYGPGWTPGTPRLGNYHELAEKVNRNKFSKELSYKMQIYSIVHFILLTLLQQYLSHHKNEMSDPIFYGGCFYLIVSLVSLGLLYNENQLFPWLEMTRCLVFLGFSSQITFTQNVFVMSILLWIIRIFYFYSAWISRTVCVDMISIQNKLKIQ